MKRISYSWAPADASSVSQLREDGRFDALVISALSGLARLTPYFFAILISFVIIVLVLFPI